MKDKIVREYYENGQLKSEGTMIITTDCTGRGGPLDCHGTGCVECLIEPVRVKIGQWKYYYTNGQLKSEGKYVLVSMIGLPVVRDGLWKFYYENGKLRMEGKYNSKSQNTDKSQDDCLHHVIEDNLPNIQGQYGVDLKQGVWKIYNHDGKLQKEITFIDNEKII